MYHGSIRDKTVCAKTGKGCGEAETRAVKNVLLDRHTLKDNNKAIKNLWHAIE